LASGKDLTVKVRCTRFGSLRTTTRPLSSKMASKSTRLQLQSVMVNLMLSSTFPSGMVRTSWLVLVPILIPVISSTGMMLRQ
jgi:hypothetical protein